MKAIARANTFDIRVLLTRVLIGAFIFLAFLYVLNTYSVISQTVALRQIVGEAAAIGDRVESLDARYVELTRDITPESLATYGMSRGEVTSYIPQRTSLGQAGSGGYEL